MKKFINQSLHQVRKLACLDFIPLLAIRLYLVPVFYVGAKSKLFKFDATVAWMGGPVADGGLGLPFPTLMVIIAFITEAAAVILLSLGLATRLMALQLLVFLIIAALTVHWVHGWPVIAGNTDESTLRLSGLMEWLQDYFPGRYNYVTEYMDPVMLNNGVEFTVTYMIMLSVLLFFGAGRFVSCDYWIKRIYYNHK